MKIWKLKIIYSNRFIPTLPGLCHADHTWFASFSLQLLQTPTSWVLMLEATSFGRTNIDPSTWEDKKNTGESRFPAQVRVITRKLAEHPLEEDSFSPILHHYDGPKFCLELNILEALSVLDIFEENKN